jgi:hypothetical protein
MKIKVTLMAILLIFHTNVYADIIGDFIDGVFGNVSETVMSLFGNDGTTSVDLACYEFDGASSSTSFDMKSLCGLVKFNYSNATDVCSSLPEIPGFKKVSLEKTVGFNTNALYDYCMGAANDSEKSAKSIISSAEVLSADNDPEVDTFPNGETKESFYVGGSNNKAILDVDSLKKEQRNSLTGLYLYSTDKNNQENARYLINLAKKNNVQSVSDITAEDIKVPEDGLAYEKDVRNLAGLLTNDLNTASTSSVSSKISSKTEFYTDAAGQKEQTTKAATVVDEINQIIEKSSFQRKGVYKALLSSPDDLAIPTQQTVDMYRDELKPKYAAKIQKQQMKEAYVDMLIDTQTKLMQELTSLTARKVIVMKSQFDEAAASQAITDLVKD